MDNRASRLMKRADIISRIAELAGEDPARAEYVDQSAALLGRDEAVRRLRLGLEKLSAN